MIGSVPQEFKLVESQTDFLYQSSQSILFTKNPPGPRQDARLKRGLQVLINRLKHNGMLIINDIEKNYDESEAYKPERMARTTTKLKSKAESLTVLEARRSSQH